MSLRAAVQLVLDEARAALPWLDDEAARGGDGAHASIASLDDGSWWGGDDGAPLPGSGSGDGDGDGVRDGGGEASELFGAADEDYGGGGGDGDGDGDDDEHALQGQQERQQQQQEQQQQGPQATHNQEDAWAPGAWACESPAEALRRAINQAAARSNTEDHEVPSVPDLSSAVAALRARWSADALIAERVRRPNESASAWTPAARAAARRLELALGNGGSGGSGGGSSSNSSSSSSSSSNNSHSSACLGPTLLHLRVESASEQCELAVLDSTTWRELRESIACPQDHCLGGAVRREAYLFMLGDRVVLGPEGEALARTLEDWARRSGLPHALAAAAGLPRLGAQACIADTPGMRVGKPYVFVHQGDCEHRLTVSAVQLAHPLAHPHNAALYPMLLRATKSKLANCDACAKLVARYRCDEPEPGTLAGLGAPTPLRLCHKCLQALLFDQAGKPVAPSVRALPYWGEPEQHHDRVACETAQRPLKPRASCSRRDGAAPSYSKS
jgi:hypothetical protein